MNTKYEAGDIIKLKDLRTYKVLHVTPEGYLVTEETRNLFVMTPVFYISLDFLNEASRRGALFKQNPRPTQAVTPKQPSPKRKKTKE